MKKRRGRKVNFVVVINGVDEADRDHALSTHNRAKSAILEIDKIDHLVHLVTGEHKEYRILIRTTERDDLFAAPDSGRCIEELVEELQSSKQVD